MARGEDAVRVEGLLDGEHRADLGWCMLKGEEGRLRETDTVFAGDRAAEFDDLLHDFADGLFGLSTMVRVEPVVHDVHVKVAVGRVAEGRCRQADAVAQLAGETEERDIAADWHHHVFVELRVAEGEHRLGAGAAEFPEGFGFCFVLGGAEGDRMALGPGDDLDGVVGEGGGMPIDLDE